MRKRYRLWLLIVALSVVAGWFPVERASAHASLVKALPEPNSKLGASPGEIILTFNERLERALYVVKIFDDIGRPAAKENAQMSQDQRELSLPLPPLTDGLYTVTYHVISADGHPVSGTYVLSIGDQPGSGDAAAHAGLHQGHSISSEMSADTALQFLTRMLYYVSLVSLLGWVLWGASTSQGAARALYVRWSVSFQRAHLLLLLALIGTHYGELLGDQGWDRLPALFTGTNIGLYWLVALVLSFLGFVVLHRRTWLDIGWACALIVAKSMNGHAVALAPGLLGAGLDSIHLAAAAVWAGGLWVLILFWKRDKTYAQRLLPRFSAVALLTMAILATTGIVSTLLFLPAPSYLLYSQWGYVLLAKTGLVLLVIAVAGILRIVMRRNPSRTRFWLAIDFGMMLLIAMLVGVLTYLSPIPANEPLYWHEMGKNIHMTAKIAPNVPGQDNAFFVQVWLAQSLGPPKYVELRLTPLDRPELAPIEVPLKEEAAEEDPSFVGAEQMAKYAYRDHGPLLPFPGKWAIEVRVLDRNDDETVYRREMRLY